MGPEFIMQRKKWHHFLIIFKTLWLRRRTRTHAGKHLCSQREWSAIKHSALNIIYIKKDPSIPYTHTAASTRRAARWYPHMLKYTLNLWQARLKKRLPAACIHYMRARRTPLKFCLFLHSIRHEETTLGAAKWQEVLFLRRTHLSSVWLTPAFFRLRRSQSAAPANKQQRCISIRDVIHFRQQCLSARCDKKSHYTSQTSTQSETQKNKRW